MIHMMAQDPTLLSATQTHASVHSVTLLGRPHAGPWGSTPELDILISVLEAPLVTLRAGPVTRRAANSGENVTEGFQRGSCSRGQAGVEAAPSGAARVWAAKAGAQHAERGSTAPRPRPQREGPRASAEGAGHLPRANGRPQKSCDQIGDFWPPSEG